MTIIAGVVCKAAVVVASDSQATGYRGVPIKRSDYLKIHDCTRETDLPAVMIGAGSSAYVAKAVEAIYDRCKKERLSNLKELIDHAENAMVDLVRKYVTERMQNLVPGLEGRRTLERMQTMPFMPGVEPPDLALMLAGIGAEGEPLLYTLGPQGVAQRDDNYATLGSGSAYAEMALRRLYRGNMSPAEALNCAIYAVEEAKVIAPHCGGPTQAVVVKPNGVRRLTRDEVIQLVKRLEIRDELLSDLSRAMVLGYKTSSEVKRFLGQTPKAKQKSKTA